MAFHFMIATVDCKQRGILCANFTFPTLRWIYCVFIDWVAHADLIGIGRSVQVQTLFIPHEDL